MNAELFVAAVQGMGDGVIVVNAAGEYLLFNDEAKRLVGLPTEGDVDLAAWRKSIAIYSADGRRLSPDQYPAQRVLAGEPSEQVPLVIRDEHGAERSICVTARVFEAPGAGRCSVAVVRDVTREKRLERQLHVSQMLLERDTLELRAMGAKLSALLDHMSTAVLFENAERRVEIVNRAFCKLFGLSDPSVILGALPQERAHIVRMADPEGFLRVKRRRVERGTSVHSERVDTADGRILERDYVPLNVEGVVEGHFWCYRDVTDRERARERLAELSNRDELTALYNRRGFVTLAEQWLRIAARTKRTPLLLFVDVNGMKPVNDGLGHAIGDRVLRDTADLLRATFRDSDIIARLGGDEFVVLAVDAMPEHAKLLCDRLDRNTRVLNEQGQRPYHVSISVGVSVWDPAQPRSIDELLAEADARMYEAKRRAKAQAAPAAASGI